MSPAFSEKLRSALKLELPYPERPPKVQGTPASVLLLFGVGDDPENPALLVTRRTDHVEKHKGQMAFPGGMREEGESDLEAALRETEEEVGIPRERVEIIGELPKLWTVTDFWVTPVVGVLKSSISEIEIECSPHEIADVHWISLSVLQHSDTYKKEWIERGPIRFPVHAYYVGPERQVRIWGATGAMIHNLLERLARISG